MVDLEKYEELQYADLVATMTTNIACKLILLNELSIEKALDVIHYSDFYDEVEDEDSDAWTISPVFVYRDLCVDNDIEPQQDIDHYSFPELFPMEFSLKVFETYRVLCKGNVRGAELHYFFAKHKLYEMLRASYEEMKDYSIFEVTKALYKRCASSFNVDEKFKPNFFIFFRSETEKAFGL